MEDFGERAHLMASLRANLASVQANVAALNTLEVRVSLSVLLPEGVRDGYQGTSGLTLNGYILSVSGKFSAEL
jgi:hypothetical protein